MDKRLLFFLLASCTPNESVTHALSANAIAQGANASLEAIARRYRVDILGCVQTSETRAQAETCIQGVDFTWATIWREWKDFREAHTAWADGLENGRQPKSAYEAMAMAWCALETSTADLVSLPKLPLSCKGDP